MTAAQRILRKSLVASGMDSRQWSAVDAGLRDRSFFSATVEDARVMGALREPVAMVAAGEMDASSARIAMRDATGWQGASRDEPVALKLSPIWARLSRFGTPYPPFDFNSGMGVEDVGRRKARELGLLEDGSGDGAAPPNGGSGPQSPSAPPSFNANLQATVPTMRGDSPEAEWLRAKFGDQIDIRNGAVKWKGELIQGVLGGAEKRAEFGVASRAFLDAAASGGVDPETVKAFEGRKISLSHQFFREHGGKHLDPDGPYGHLVPAEFELLPWLWRSPSRVRPTRDPNRVQAELDTLDGGWLLAIIDCRSGLKSIQKRKAPGGIA